MYVCMYIYTILYYIILYYIILYYIIIYYIILLYIILYYYIIYINYINIYMVTACHCIAVKPKHPCRHPFHPFLQASSDLHPRIAQGAGALRFQRFQRVIESSLVDASVLCHGKLSFFGKSLLFNGIPLISNPGKKGVKSEQIPFISH